MGIRRRALVVAAAVLVPGLLIGSIEAAIAAPAHQPQRKVAPVREVADVSARSVLVQMTAQPQCRAHHATKRSGHTPPVRPVHARSEHATKVHGMRACTATSTPTPTSPRQPSPTSEPARQAQFHQPQFSDLRVPTQHRPRPPAPAPATASASTPPAKHRAASVTGSVALRALHFSLGAMPLLIAALLAACGVGLLRLTRRRAR